MSRRIVTALAILMLLGLILQAEAVPRVRRSCVIGWNAVTTYTDASAATIVNYRIYTSTTSGSYGAYTLQVAGNVLTAGCRALGLSGHNQQYYVRVTAVDGASSESAPSSEFSVVVTRGQGLFRH